MGSSISRLPNNLVAVSSSVVGMVNPNILSGVLGRSGSQRYPLRDSGLVSSLKSVGSFALVKLSFPVELGARVVGSFLVIISSVSNGSRVGRTLVKSAVVAMWVHWALLIQ